VSGAGTLGFCCKATLVALWFGHALLGHVVETDAGTATIASPASSPSGALCRLQPTHKGKHVWADCAGDIVAVSVREKVVALCAMFIGAAVFGYFMGSMSMMVSATNSNRARWVLKRRHHTTYNGTSTAPGNACHSTVLLLVRCQHTRSHFSILHTLLPVTGWPQSVAQLMTSSHTEGKALWRRFLSHCQLRHCLFLGLHEIMYCCVQRAAPEQAEAYGGSTLLP
jgi:hypothetical protein